MENNDVLELLDEKILAVLKNNNFSLNKLGTYFYKDVIKKIVISFKACSNDEANVDLLKAAVNPYSELYKGVVRCFFNVNEASDDLVLEFHQIIKDACADTKITKGKSGNINNYLVMSYYFAKYMLSSFERENLDVVDNDSALNRASILSESKVKAHILSKPIQK